MEEVGENAYLLNELLLYQSTCRILDELDDAASGRPTSTARSLGRNGTTLYLSLSDSPESTRPTTSGSAFRSPWTNSRPREWPEVESQIRLELGRWTRLLKQKLERIEDQRERIHIILEYFLDVAIHNNLNETPAAQIIRNCLGNMDASSHHAKVDDPSASANLWAVRIGQRTYEEVKREVEQAVANSPPSSNELVHQNSSTALVQIQPDVRFSPTSLIHEIPLFNLWDALSFIYSKTVEPIDSPLLAELHLYQFWTIVLILRDCYLYFPSWAMPTTAAASWTNHGSGNGSFIIAFGTTCVGPKSREREMGPRTPGAKQEMRDLRREHITRLKWILNLAENALHINRTLDGNCPEWFIFPSVISGPGTYFSLCFGWDRDEKNVKSMKFCPSCIQLAEHLRGEGMNVVDLWKRALLVDPSQEFGGQYPHCFLVDGKVVVQRAIDAGFEDDIHYPDLPKRASTER